MSDAESVEEVQGTHNIEQHFVRPAITVICLMRAWVVNPNELPESCATSFHSYVEVCFTQVVADPQADHLDDVGMTIGMEHVVTRGLPICLVSVSALPLDEHRRLLEFVESREDSAEAALADCTLSVFSNTLEA